MLDCSRGLAVAAHRPAPLLLTKRDRRRETATTSNLSDVSFMKTCLQTAWTHVLFVLLLVASTGAEARQFNDKQIQRLISQMRQVDFEGFGVFSSSCDVVIGAPLGPVIVPRIDNPLTIGGMIIETPHCLQVFPCEAPICEPDPDNIAGANILLRIEPGATITFVNTPDIAVVDLQGNGRRFTLRVTDSLGKTFDVQRQPELFSKMLLPLFSPRGIHSVELLEVEMQEDDGPPALHIAAVYLP